MGGLGAPTLLSLTYDLHAEEQGNFVAVMVVRSHELSSSACSSQGLFTAARTVPHRHLSKDCKLLELHRRALLYRSAMQVLSAGQIVIPSCRRSIISVSVH